MVTSNGHNWLHKRRNTGGRVVLSFQSLSYML